MNEGIDGRRTDHNTKVQTSINEKQQNLRDSHTHATVGNASGSRASLSQSHATKQSEIESDTMNSSFDDSGLFNDSTLRKYRITQRIYHHWTKQVIKTLVINLVFAIIWVLLDMLVFRVDNPYTGNFYNYHGLLNAVLIFVQSFIGLCVCWSIDSSSLIDHQGLERRLSNLKIFNRIIFLIVLVLEVLVVILILTKGNDYTIDSKFDPATSTAPEVQHGTLYVTYHHSPLQLYLQFFISILAILVSLALSVASAQLAAQAHRFANLERLMKLFCLKGSQL